VVSHADEWWSSFDRDPRVTGNRALRAADRDRDLVRQLLTDAFADGRLDRDEFDQRSEEVAATRTLGELPALVADLVPVDPSAASSRGLLTPAQLQERAIAHWRSDRREAVWGFIAISVITWVIWLVTSFGDGAFDPGFPWPLFVSTAAGLNLGRIQFTRQDRIEHERRRLERKQAKAIEAGREEESE